MHVRSPWLVAIALTSLVPLMTGCGDDDGDGTATTGSGASGPGGQGGAGGTGGQGGAAGGQGGDGGTGGVGTQSVEIDFVAQVGASAFDCADTYPGLGTQATEVEFRDFRLYVHDVRLLEAGTGAEVPVELTDDGAWQHVPDGAPAEGTVLLDFENNGGSCQNGTAETNGMVVGTVPEGSYDGVRFKVGVPAALNHADVALADSPLNLTAMFWSWNGGYKFIRIDTAPVGQPDPFNMHLGSTACTGDATLGENVTCDNPNRPEITLDDFDPTQDRIVIDYAEIVAATDLSVNQVGAPGCMSGPTDTDCLTPFAAVGLDHENGQPLPAQTAFRVD